MEAKKKLLYLKPPTVQFKRANKMKDKGGSANTAKAKKIVKNAKKPEFVQDIKGVEKQIFDQHRIKSTDSKEAGPKHDLDRFKSKKKS